MKTLYLNKLNYNDISSFPVKLKLFFIIKFFTINLTTLNNMIYILKNYNENDNSETVDSLIFKILDNYQYEIFGNFFNGYVTHTSLKNDYVYLWNNLIDSCRDIPFDIILLLCEKFNIPILPKHIPKLIGLKGYTEDNAIYMIKSEKISTNNLNEIMEALEILYDDAMRKKYNILCKVIRTIPYFVSYLEENRIVEFIKEYPYVLQYNLNKNPINFDLCKDQRDVLSVRLRHLSFDDNLKEFSSTNRLLSIVLSNRLFVPLDKTYNVVFYNYCYKLNTNIGDYDENTNYCSILIDIHLELMAKPVIDL